MSQPHAQASTHPYLARGSAHPSDPRVPAGPCGAEYPQIWTAFVPIVIDLASAPNGGSARSYQPGFA
jgi:hypothetical protein